MRRMGVVVALVAVASVIPAIAFAQAPIGAWCGGSYGPTGTNFGPCPTAQAGAQVAGQASGVQGQSVATEPQYPSSQVTFEDGKAYFNKQELRLNYGAFPDRSNEIQSPGDGGE